MFQLIDGTPGLGGHLFEPNPDQERTTDMITLNTGTAQIRVILHA